MRECMATEPGASCTRRGAASAPMATRELLLAPMLLLGPAVGRPSLLHMDDREEAEATELVEAVLSESHSAPSQLPRLHVLARVLGLASLRRW